MKIDVILTPAELPRLSKRDLGATDCVVFDVLRATSTFVTALHHGARAIIPVSEISEALEIKKKHPKVLTAGERHGVKITARGTVFDFGNSPREVVPAKVKGRKIVSTTTNGTRALRACAHAGMVLAGAFLNLRVTARFLLNSRSQNVLLICAGTGENAALEDIIAAGALCQMLAKAKPSPVLSDAALVALSMFRHSKESSDEVICESENARRLLAMPELRGDVEFCLQRDIFNVIARMKAGEITAVRNAR
jgi:2-phosphosulfolactate phosphatase